MGWSMKKWMAGVVLLFGVWSFGSTAQAGGFYDNPYVTFTEDGGAWTVAQPLPTPQDAWNGEDPSCWYPRGEQLLTGIASSLDEPGIGEHYYMMEREGVIPIGKWVVAHRPSRCIHRNAMLFHGYEEPGIPCYCSYYSGWNAYCADCGELVSQCFFYLSRERVRTLQEIDVSLDYYYHCPTCGHMEQGRRLSHKCKAISANRYRVVYRPNAGDSVGNIQPSFHMYDNADRYEGEPVTPCSFLTECTFFRQGYRFLGWNTRPDGSGEFYEDGAQILNLTWENYDPDRGTGTVVLYAQWEKHTGRLRIDPGEGRFLGQSGIHTYDVGYREQFYVGADRVTPPRGYTVTFETGEGAGINPKVSSLRFLLWKLRTPAAGSLLGDRYEFLGRDGEEDLLTAVYESEGILLPLPVRQGYSFGGWYRDAAFQYQVGNAGDLFQPKEDTTLYAAWVDLTLQATVNLTANGGKGAVDLSWQQEDGQSKTYLVFGRPEGELFSRIYGTGDQREVPEEELFEFTAREETYQVPYSGLYTLRAYGAQGQDWRSSPGQDWRSSTGQALQDSTGEYRGGRGGMAQGTFYLEEGDVLTISVGGMDGFGLGGAASVYGGGGGRSLVSSKQLGVLIVAGGGGGASPAGPGGDGGLEEGLRSDENAGGEAGKSGGGAGYVGGRAGEYSIHIHEEACLHVHDGDQEAGGDCYRESAEQGTCRFQISGPYRAAGQTTNCDTCFAAGRNGYGTMRMHSWRVSHLDCGEAPDDGSNGWWQCDVCGRIGYVWGSGTLRPAQGQHTYQRKLYVLDCEIEYDCTMPPGTMLPSHGGASYVDERARGYERQAGVRTGDGCVGIKPLSVGYRNTLEQKGVAAPDLEAPHRISVESIVKQATPEGRVRITFDQPGDVGSCYQHQVKSYLPDSEGELSVSNITSTEVITGVKGYYYLIDSTRDTIVDRDNAQGVLSSGEICVEVTDRRRYLHLAPVDGAGNVGESVSIELCGEDDSLAWLPVTEKIVPSSIVGERDYGSVAARAEGGYYVRADGRTPFSLSFAARLTGPARETYQISRMGFLAGEPGERLPGEYRMLVPCAPMETAESYYPGQDLGRQTSGREILSVSLQGWAYRSQANRVLEVAQGFTLGREFDGKQITVIPRAGAELSGNVTWSLEEADERNKVLLVGDGQPPEIGGLEQARELLLEERDIPWELDLTAEDDLSGVAGFQAVLLNLDNDWEVVYLPDATGHIRIRMDEDSPLFSGDIRLTVTAVDLVGNRNEQEINASEFTLETAVYRLLAPHDPLFKRGESGVLRITARGYATRIEVEFPPEFTAHEPGLDRVYSYPVPDPVALETIEFMVPLYLPKDQEYTILVRAYKEGLLLEERPGLCTFEVAGSILGELRTRLR